jgi:hypothetical protein
LTLTRSVALRISDKSDNFDISFYLSSLCQFTPVSSHRFSVAMSSSHVEKTTGPTDNEVRRLHTHEMEIGITDAVQRHVQRHVIAPKPVSQQKLDFEHARPRWMREMAAEAMGVFFYV